MMKTIRVAEASNIQLDWLVAKCEGKEAFIIEEPYYQAGELVFKGEYDWSGDRHIEADYTTNWSQMGPIIEREGLDVYCYTIAGDAVYKNPEAEEMDLVIDHLLPDTTTWSANTISATHYVTGDGPTYLIAAARCYIVSKLGEEVEVPEELT